jgi:AcrR family transcriptional regulator
MTNSRETLIDTMKALLWKRGYDATSPNQVLEESGVGKGSLYHHFKSKKALAVAAMDDRADELIEEANQIFTSNQFWLAKFKHYLTLPRDGMAGCRLGRITLDPSVADDPDLQRPIKRYFSHLHQLMSATLSEAQTSDDMATTVLPEPLAYTIIASLQGGFIVSRACDDGTILNQGIEGVYSLLQSLSVEH